MCMCVFHALDDTQLNSPASQESAESSTEMVENPLFAKVETHYDLTDNVWWDQQDLQETFGSSRTQDAPWIDSDMSWVKRAMEPKPDDYDSEV